MERKGLTLLAPLAGLVLLLGLLPTPALAGDAALEERVRVLEQELAELRGEPRSAEVAGTQEKESGITFGGALRVNYSYVDYDQDDHERLGDFDFDTFRINVDGTLKSLLFSAEYRFYPQDDWHAPHHGWVGYDFTDSLQGQLGIHQVPFGLQPYASHNFWFSGAYYIGLEDDYDLGLKFLWDRGPFDWALAFYKNAELGNPNDAGRYSVDVISNADGGYAGAQPAGNEESNQFNLRGTYTLKHSDKCSTEIGLSGQWGQLYNSITKDNGDHWAAAAHLNGDYGRWNLQLEYAAYGYDPENPPGFDDDVITMGAYSFSWGVPAEGQVGIANLAYTLPVNWGPIDSLTFYSDNTVIEPDSGRFDTIWQNVVGTLVAAGPLYTYIDLISAEEMIFMGGNMVGPEASFQSTGRNTRLNINFGYYF